MNRLPLVSIIIPVYNLENYIAICLESVIRQTYSNIEIILVDDGSTDNSIVICNKYGNIDSRIKIIHQHNQGQSAARNAGLEVMRGEYVTFIDGDDYVHIEYINLLYQMCSCNNCQISQCSYETVYNGTFFDNKRLKEDTIVYGTKDAFLSRRMRASVWARLYESKLFRDERFAYGKIYEDEDMTYKLVYKAQNVALTENKLYYYYQRSGSTMKNKNLFLSTDFIPIFEKRIRFFKDRDNDLYKIAKEVYGLSLIRFYVKCCSDSNNMNDKDNLIYRFNVLFEETAYEAEISTRTKFIFRTFKLSPRYFAKICCKYMGFIESLHRFKMRLKCKRCTSGKNENSDYIR